VVKLFAMRARLTQAGLVALALCAAILAAPPSVLAQDRVVRGGPAGEFDFYVLALSWSPGFCTLEGDGKNRNQCRSGSGLGFVVHGLWPQNERGYPTDCGPAGRTPSRQAMDVAREVFPEEGLARHQWRKHGVCAGSSPTDYFNDVKRVRAAVVVPPQFKAVDKVQTWAPIDLERAFVAANPGLRADMMSVACRRNELQEVRICLSKDLRSFRTCQEVDRGGCRTRDISVQPVR
jgi:ribonuclease T2